MPKKSTQKQKNKIIKNPKKLTLFFLGNLALFQE